jgi:hypothetical protein
LGDAGGQIQAQERYDQVRPWAVRVGEERTIRKAADRRTRVPHAGLLHAAATIAAVLMSGCTQAGIVRPGETQMEKPGESGLTQAADGKQRLTVTGVRVTQGNAVDCPQIKTADGSIVPVSYLSPSIAIGDKVEVTGYMAVTTKCRGKVLYAEETRKPG